MKQTIIKCDSCGKPDAQEISVWLDRRMGGAGSMENEWTTVDLCPMCMARERRRAPQVRRGLGSQSEEGETMMMEREYIREKLSPYRITICGAGALGSNLAESLVRQGITRLKCIDKDHVEAKNTANQIYTVNDVGALKITVLHNRLFTIAEVETDLTHKNKELTEANAKLLLKQSDIVCDVFDNSASRQLVQDECRARKIPRLHLDLHEAYGECCWDQHYRVPKDPLEGDACDMPLSRNLVMLVVAVGAEEVLDFCLAKEPRMKSWSVTLRDLKISEM